MKQRAQVIEHEDVRAATAAAFGASADAIIEAWLERVGRRRDSRTYQEARATGLMDWLIAGIACVGPALPPPERVASFVQIRRRQGGGPACHL